MNAKVRFISLLIVLILLTSLLMNASEINAPAKRNSRAGDFMGLILAVLFVDALLLLILIAYYRYDRFSAKRRKDVVSEVDIFSVILYSIFLPLLILFFGKAVAARSSKGLVLNSTVSSPTASPDMILHRVVSSQRSISLYSLFLIPIFVGVGYLAYHYVVAWSEEVRRKKKLETAISFDRKLDDLGLDQFDGPRDAIIQIYKNAVLWLEALGIPYQESWTHWEHAEHVNYMRNFYSELVRRGIL